MRSAHERKTNRFGTIDNNYGHCLRSASLCCDVCVELELLSIVVLKCERLKLAKQECFSCVKQREERCRVPRSTAYTLASDRHLASHVLPHLQCIIILH